MAGDEAGGLCRRTRRLVRDVVVVDLRLRRVIVMTRRGVRQVRTGLRRGLSLVRVQLGLWGLDRGLADS